MFLLILGGPPLSGLTNYIASHFFIPPHPLQLFPLVFLAGLLLTFLITEKQVLAIRDYSYAPVPARIALTGQPLVFLGQTVLRKPQPSLRPLPIKPECPHVPTTWHATPPILDTCVCTGFPYDI